MRILIQLFSHQPQTLLALAASTAEASARQGHEVAFFLACDGAYVADPEQWLVSSKMLGGLDDPKETIERLRARGVPFYVNGACAAFRQIEAGGPVVLSSFDQLAVELPNFDRVLTYGP